VQTHVAEPGRRCAHAPAVQRMAVIIQRAQPRPQRQSVETQQPRPMMNIAPNRFTPSALNIFDIVANKETVMPVWRADR
jgi:hypothetical protein